MKPGPGWPFGGVVAQEMAVQLRATDEQTGTLVLLDAYPPHRQDLTLAATTHPAHTIDGDEGPPRSGPTSSARPGMPSRSD
ncbi:thioesterase domain-containing protein [Streptomyces sp. NPDC093097]|uniref:thioesterase domain-containing protein n=1 Tax=Streptomyces sp. NPDC093097 TaxID=3366027 RepID=UPI00381F00B0